MHVEYPVHWVALKGMNHCQKLHRFSVIEVDLQRTNHCLKQWHVRGDWYHHGHHCLNDCHFLGDKNFEVRSIYTGFNESQIKFEGNSLLIFCLLRKNLITFLENFFWSDLSLSPLSVQSPFGVQCSTLTARATARVVTG